MFHCSSAGEMKVFYKKRCLCPHRDTIRDNYAADVCCSLRGHEVEAATVGILPNL